MATVPLSATNIRLISGVPFSNDYKHTRWFDTLLEQTTYFEGKPLVHSITEATFQRDTVKTFLSINKSIDELRGVNYVMFQNTPYNNKWFYAFVTKIEYINRGTTYVHVQLDVFQTWRFDMNFKPSFVLREHCKLWNSDGTPVINTVDEGLAYGTDYDTVFASKYVPYNNIYFLVIVCKKTMHGGSADIGKIKPMLNGSPQPLTYYVHPFKLDGTNPTVLVDGMDIALSPLKDVLKNLYTQEDAVNNIVSLYVTDYTGYGMGYSEVTGTLTVSSNVLSHALIQDSTGSMNTLYLEKITDYDTWEKSFGSKWTGYKAVTESKLLMYPYTQLILDDFKGSRAVFKNEYINDTELRIKVKGSLGTSNKVSYGVDAYNNTSTTLQDELTDEFALINNEPNDVPIITDLLSAYLQGNKNSIQNQKNSAVFNGIMGGITSMAGGIASNGVGNPMGVAMAGAGLVQGLGNTALQIQGIEAKQKDIANVPPQISKMGSNTAYSIGNGFNGLFVIKKQIKDEYIKKLEHFFKMFGYKVNEVKLPNFHTRTKWNYVQTSSCIITGNFNNDDLADLKAVFDNGITLWHVDDVGNYSLENGVI